MEISHRIDPERGIIYLELRGEVSVAEIQEYRMRIVRDRAYSVEFGRLTDARGVTGDLTRADIRRLADIVRGESHAAPLPRRAVVVSDQTYLRGMEVLLAYTSGNPVEIRVFSSVTQAEHWLTS